MSNKTAVIIGAGPAGMAAAAVLSRSGTKTVLIERSFSTGGILNQCIHNGFGLELYGEDLTGPQFSERMAADLGPGTELRLSTTVTAVKPVLSGGFTVTALSRGKGLEFIEADAVLVAAGCRERTRENIEVPGTRPAGVFTAGQAQALINMNRLRIGRTAVIQGSGDIGLIMARRLRIEGYRVLAVLERLPYLSGKLRNKVQCLDHMGIPLFLGRSVTRINGKARLTSVDTEAAGNPMRFECDTVLFASGLIPELETAKTAGIHMQDALLPAADSGFCSSVPGLFLAGNCLHINDLADSAAAEGRAAAESMLEYLKNPEAFRPDSNPPYRKILPRTDLDSGFFRKLENGRSIVCIVCPKGCILSGSSSGCRRGREYYNQAGPGRLSGRSAPRQRLHTTLSFASQEGEIVCPVVSETEIEITLLDDILRKLSHMEGTEFPADGRLVIENRGLFYSFIAVRREARR